MRVQAAVTLLLALCASGACAARTLSQAPPAQGGSCSTVYQVIDSNPDLSTLKAAVDVAGLQATLDDPSLVATILAPNNAGIARTLRDGGATEAQLLENTQLLRTLLTYHVVPGRALQAADLKQGLKFRTLQGGEFAVDEASIEQDPKYAGCDYRDIHLDTYVDEDPEPRQCDLQACQSVVHIVDYLLVPDEPGMKQLLPNAEFKTDISG